ncbi:MCP four helix bundle domain-containing protein [Bdellovibrio bacteriovorus]|uniref:MCP four helix bundle domain-containing protein n=1 Tax=Bdellovibrio bacteriovorus TaxID=959 RepID=UPI0035A66B3C
MLSRFSLKAKMLLAFMGISMLLLVVGGLGFYSNSKVVAIYDRIANLNLPNVEALGRIRYRAQEANRTMLRAVMARTPEEVAHYTKQYGESLELYDSFIKKYLEVPFFNSQEEALFNKVDASWKKYVAMTNDIVKNAGKPEHNERILKLLDEELREIRREHVDGLGALLSFHEEAVKQAKIEAADTTRQGQVFVSLVIAFGFISACVVGFIFANSLARSLTRISGDISNSADQTSASGTQLSAASQQLSSGSSEAAASLEETVASIEELSSMVKLNADHAKEANALSQKSKDSAEQGEGEITKLIGAMEDIASGSKKNRRNHHGH